MQSFLQHVSSRSADIQQAAAIAWESLGVFAWLFVAALAIAGCYLVRGWRLLARHVSPLAAGQPGTAELIGRLIAVPTSTETIDRELFNGKAGRRDNLFLSYIGRFSQRDRRRPPGPSLTQATDEQWQLGRIQNQASTLRFLGMVLPALGLLGTLIGMFNAFFGTDFAGGGALATTMESLMQNFALALFTTIVAVLLKIVIDLLNHFTIEVHVNDLRGDLARVRTMLLDAADAGVPSVVDTVPDPAVRLASTPTAEMSHA